MFMLFNVPKTWNFKAAIPYLKNKLAKNRNHIPLIWEHILPQSTKERKTVWSPVFGFP